jgi:hypothetical protein
LPLIDRPVFACFLPPMLLLAHAAAMPPRYFADFCRFARFQLLSLACRFARFFISAPRWPGAFFRWLRRYAFADVAALFRQPPPRYFARGLTLSDTFFR